MKEILDQFNFKKTAQELGVSVWQTPSFLFLVMGILISVIMVILFLVTRNSSDPMFLILAECFVAMTMLSVGSSIIGRVADIAKINQLKTRFIELASNRLKDPLATMRWELEILLERTEGELNEKQKARINSVIESNESMINLVKDLLDVTRIEDIKKIEGKDKISIDGLMRAIIHDQKEYAQSRSVEVTYESKFPQQYIRGDQKLVKIAVENLISNAIRFSPKNKKVEITASAGIKDVNICVKDQGYGIPDEEKDQVFSKFFRASNILNHDIEGTGLGLYVTKRIVDGLGGKVWFKSKKEAGSQFFIKLPIFNAKDK